MLYCSGKEVAGTTYWLSVQRFKTHEGRSQWNTLPERSPRSPGRRSTSSCWLPGPRASARRRSTVSTRSATTPASHRPDGRSQLLYTTERAEGLRNAKSEAESAFYDYLMDGLDQASQEAFLAALDSLYRRSKTESRAGFPHLRPAVEGNAHEKD